MNNASSQRERLQDAPTCPFVVEMLATHGDLSALASGARRHSLEQGTFGEALVSDQ